MTKSDYRVIMYLNRLRLQKGADSYEELYIWMANESKTPWWDGRDGDKGREGCLKIAPELVGKLSKRYFEFLSIGNYREKQFFHKVIKNHIFKSKDQHVVNPGDKVLLKLFVRARTYTPVGKQNIDIGLIERETKKKLIRNQKSISGKVKITSTPYKDSRMANLQSVGEIDSTYENENFRSIKALSQKQAVIMAVWKRVDRLPISIEAFSLQNGVDTVLYLWVNNRGVDEEIKKVVDNSQLPIKVYFSPNNIGGYGRFYLAKDIADKHKTVIFIDDDQVPSKGAFKVLAEEHRPKTILGPYATRTPSRNDYWLRDEINPGEEADYVATSGMICETTIFKDSPIFNCPKKYWFIEDLWLCYVAKYKYGWQLKKSKAIINTEQDEVGQWRPMIDLKNEFFRYLLKNGMSIHEREVK